MRLFKDAMFLIVISVIIIGFTVLLSCTFQFWLIDYIIGCGSGVLLGVMWLRFITDIDDGIYMDWARKESNMQNETKKETKND